MSKWLYRLSLLTLLRSLSHSSGSNSGTRWLTTCRLQTLLTGAQSLIRQNRSADMLPALPSTSRKPRPPPSPYFLCKAEDCHRSKVLLLMEQLLIPQPKRPLSTCDCRTNYTISVVAGWRSRPVHHHLSREDGQYFFTWLSNAVILTPSRLRLTEVTTTILHGCACQTCFKIFYCLSLQIKMHSNHRQSCCFFYISMTFSSILTRCNIRTPNSPVIEN